MKIKTKLKIRPYKIIPLAVGMGGTFGCAITMYLTFLHAYFNGSYSTKITINTVGEAHLEFVLIPVCLILSIWGYIFMFKHMEKTT